MSADDPVVAGGGGRDVVRAAARAYERDRYLAALLAPRPVRDELIAVAAFGGEIARIPSYVSEPMMGEIRLQWWRDALAAAADGAATGHPIADAVGAAMRRHTVSPDLPGGVIEAMRLRLCDAPPGDDEALLSHLDEIEGALFTFAWRILEGPGEFRAPELLEPSGRTYGIARLLHEFPAVLAQGRTLIPQTRLDRHGLSLDVLRSGDRPRAVHELVSELAAEVRGSLAAIAHRLRHADRALRTALLPVALVEPYLRSSQMQHYNRLGAVVEVSPLTRVWRMWLAHRIGRI